MMKHTHSLRKTSDSRRGRAAVAAAVGVAALLVALAAPSCDRDGVRTVKISGRGLDFYPDSARMLVFPYGADFRFDPPVASAVIVDGAFELSFRDSVTRLCEMAVEEEMATGAFHTYPFFTDGKPLRFTFRRKFETPRAEVEGSADNEELYLYRNRWNDLYAPVDSLSWLRRQWLQDNYGDGFPEEGSDDYRWLHAEFDRASALADSIFEAADYEGWLLDRIRRHRTQAGLFELTEALDREVRMAKRDPRHPIDTTLLNLYREYRALYPGSWLVGRTDEALASVDRVAPGAPFPDFEAPMLDGARCRLGELIEGRIAVLDCWASWCLSCRRHSIELIPLYEKYRDRGFTVVGVAREYDDLDDMRLAIEKDGYPWVQLYDLDNAEGVWELYGLSSAGGGIFLIDREGRIVEKVDDIASVRSYLEEQLGQ